VAAAAHGEDPRQCPPPRELVLYWELRDFPGALPERGGLLNQPAGLIKRMRKAHQVWQVFDEFRRAKSWQVFQQTRPEAWTLKCDVDKLRQTWQNLDSGL
jgi:hypothetical protein